jgi:phosphatidylserine/phosphatidylglycerophosphate/cardiolipin synthase-like enzyme
MHAKFAIAERDGAKAALFGSWNWTTRSLWLNREIGALSENPGLLAALEARWEVLAGMAELDGTDRHER